MSEFQYQLIAMNQRQAFVISVSLVLILAISFAVLHILNVLLVLSILSIVLGISGYLVYAYSERLKGRNANLRVELLLSGAMETSLREDFQKALDLNDRIKKLLRQASNIRDATRRAKMIQEIAEISRKADDSIQWYEEQFVELQEMRRAIAKSRRKQQAIEVELDELRRQVSFIYRTRRNVEELLTTTKRISKEYALEV